MSFDTVTYEDGDMLFSAGDKAEKFFVIKSGSVKIMDPTGKHQIASLAAGASFGEQALLTGGVRAAGAQASGKTICMQITASGLRELLAKEGGLATTVLEALLLQLSMHNSLRH